jgi:class 3 adenylate cyclase
LGHTVNVAARLEQIAAPRQILISAQTYELVQPHVEVTRLEPLMVKGLADPLQVYNVLNMA